MAATNKSRQIVLASASRARREMLAAAGVPFTVDPADLDELALRNALLAEKKSVAPAHIAEALARAKVEEVSGRHAGSLVIAGDQVLALGSELLTKSIDAVAARKTLLKLRGHEHELHSAVAFAEDGNVIWAHVETARLFMRDFSDAFLDDYLVRAGDRICQSVGAYQLEGLGVQLFERVEGDYFTVLGLPLLPALEELRAQGVIAQ